MRNYRKKTLDLIDVCTEILHELQPMSLRGLFYQLVVRGYFENNRNNYQKLSRAMTAAREDGGIPWNWIVDNLRQTIKPSSWSGLADFGDSVRNCYRKDFWEHQDAYVEIFCEKDAMAAALQPVTIKYDVPLTVVRGYVSASKAHTSAETWQTIDKPIYGYYLGDFDPSGLDIERDLRAKLEQYSGKIDIVKVFDDTGVDYHYDVASALNSDGERIRHEGEGSGAFIWRRLAVNAQDFQEFDLVPMMPKKSDSRRKAFEQEHGHQCAELDAIPANSLRDRIEAAILSHVDTAEWNRLQKVEAAETKTINKLVNDLQKAG